MTIKQSIGEISVPSHEIVEVKKKDVKKTYPVLGGNIDYNTAYTYQDKNSMETIQVRPAVKISGPKAFKYVSWSMTPAFIHAIVKLWDNDSDFKRVVEQMDEFSMMDRV